MFGRRITLFRMFGFAVRADWSWLIVMALVTWSLADGVFLAAYPHLAEGVRWAMGLGGAVGLFLSIVFHELSHSLVARRYGLPMTGITLFIFGGVAEMSEEPPSATAEFAMAIAGPIASVILGGVFLGGGALLGALARSAEVASVLGWIGMINLLLAAFNLIPGFPLDGGRVLRAALWAWKKDLRRATRSASRVGSVFGLLLILLGVATLISGNFIGGLWWFLIGLFIRFAAKQGYQQVLMREAFRGEPVRRFMTADPIAVPADTTLDRLVEDYVYRYHVPMFPVLKNGRLAGCVSTEQVSHVPQAEWPRHTVEEVARLCGVENTIGPDQDALEAINRMSRTNASGLMVVADGQLLGMVTLKNLLRFFSLKMQLEGGHTPRQAT